MRYPRSPAEWAELDVLQQAIETVETAVIERVFADHRLASPFVLWQPTDLDLVEPELCFLLAYWNSLSDGGSLPREDRVDPVALRDVLDFAMLLDVIGGGADFRYRLYGPKIAERTGVDLTGEHVSNVSFDQAAPLYFLACYRAAMNRRRPLMTIRQPMSSMSAIRWTRLILPLSDESGTVSQILVGNIPGEWRVSM